MKSIFIVFIGLLCSLPSFSEVIYTREHRLNDRVIVFSEDNGKTWGAKVDDKIVVKPEYNAVSLLGNRYLCLTKYDAESQTLRYGMANLAGIIQLDCEYEHMGMRRGQLVAYRAPEVFGDEDPSDDSNVEYLAADTELLTVTVVDNIIGGKEIPAIELGKLDPESKNNILAEAAKEKAEAKAKAKAKTVEKGVQPKVEGDTISVIRLISVGAEPKAVVAKEENKDIEAASEEELAKAKIAEGLGEVLAEVSKSDSSAVEPKEEVVAENAESTKAVTEEPKAAEQKTEEVTEKTEEAKTEEPKEQAAEEPKADEAAEQKEAPAVEKVEEQKEVEKEEVAKEPVAEVVEEPKAEEVKEAKEEKTEPAPVVAVVNRIEDAPSINIDELLMTLDFERNIDMEKDFLLADAKQQKEEREAVEVVEMMPFFPGGEGELKAFIKDNLEYPEEAKVQGIQGKVVLKFLVVENGNTQDVEVVESLDENCDKEAIRIVKLMPRWQPALQDGVPVPIHFTLPISFYF